MSKLFHRLLTAQRFVWTNSFSKIFSFSVFFQECCTSKNSGTWSNSPTLFYPFWQSSISIVIIWSKDWFHVCHKKSDLPGQYYTKPNLQKEIHLTEISSIDCSHFVGKIILKMFTLNFSQLFWTLFLKFYASWKLFPTISFQDKSSISNSLHIGTWCSPTS